MALASWTHDHFTTKRYPNASIRTCNICKHTETYWYTGGHRGAGMVGGNKANGRMVQHIKAEHAYLKPGGWPFP